MEERFVARNSSERLVGLLLGSVVFVGLGLWWAGMFGSPPGPGEEWLGWITVVFFGFGFVAITHGFFDKREQIMVNRNGILARRWSNSPIPWQAIRDIEIRSVSRSRLLCLRLHDPSLYPRMGWRRVLSGPNRAMGFGDVTISTTSTDRTFKQLQAAVDHYAEVAGLVRK